ncbi:hypothetical protein HMPREF0973_01205 [Prevotella veroralis F0319]|uniref:Uncharacterized protein n=1 Tax=Prevotella veroralis F0319 TaxID=649761 RepID=C9MNL8_9BACT|nr:hypothetical protein HMPREF0973_01205 [Prevotella veroralis F0319]
MYITNVFKRMNILCTYQSYFCKCKPKMVLTPYILYIATN